MLGFTVFHLCSLKVYRVRSVVNTWNVAQNFQAVGKDKKSVDALKD